MIDMISISIPNQYTNVFIKKKKLVLMPSSALKNKNVFFRFNKKLESREECNKVDLQPAMEKIQYIDLRRMNNVYTKSVEDFSLFNMNSADTFVKKKVIQIILFIWI